MLAVERFIQLRYGISVEEINVQEASGWLHRLGIESEENMTFRWH